MHRTRLGAMLLLGCVIGAGPVLAQQEAQQASIPASVPPSVDRVVNALSKDGDPAKKFVQAYATKVADRLGNLDDFADLLTSAQTMQCNLICGARVAPAYFKPSTPTWTELVRYVFTSTCYGVSKETRLTAMEDLEATLRKLNLIDAATLFPNNGGNQGTVIVHVLGRAVLAIDSTFNPDAAGPQKFASIGKMIRASNTKWSSANFDPIDLTRELATAQACKQAVSTKKTPLK